MMWYSTITQETTTKRAEIGMEREEKNEIKEEKNHNKIVSWCTQSTAFFIYIKFDMYSNLTSTLFCLTLPHSLTLYLTFWNYFLPITYLSFVSTKTHKKKEPFDWGNILFINYWCDMIWLQHTPHCNRRKRREREE